MINLLLNVSREQRGIFQRDKEISWNIMSTCLIGAYWTLALYLLTKELWLNYVANIWRIMKPTLKATMKLMLFHGRFFLLNYARWKIRCLAVCKYITFHWLYRNLLKRLLVYDVFPLHRFSQLKDLCMCISLLTLCRAQLFYAIICSTLSPVFLKW